MSEQAFLRSVVPRPAAPRREANDHEAARFRIHILAGDHVTVAMSPYDLTRGRITFRHKT